jgi:hypothetical protein
MSARRVAGYLVAAALAGGGCKPLKVPGASDAGPDARAPLEGGAPDAGSVTGAAPATTNPDGGPLDEGALPPTSSDELGLRGRHLFEAITQDNPDLGSDMVFPRDGFMAARDAKDPGRTWDTKEAAAFRHAVHTLHRRTKDIEQGKFVAFELGRTVTQEEPRAKEWREALWVVHHSRIDYTLDGKDMHIDVAEMTSWRGAWYVTKLR